MYTFLKADNQEIRFLLLCTKPSKDKHKFVSFIGWQSWGQFISHLCQIVESSRLIYQLINQITFISESPSAVGFATLPQDRLVSVQRVRSAECDRSVMIIVQAILNRNVLTRLRNFPMDVAKRASGGRLFHTCGAAELNARDELNVLVLGSASRSFPEDPSVRDGLQSTTTSFMPQQLNQAGKFILENQEIQFLLLCTKHSKDKHKFVSFKGWSSLGRFINHPCQIIIVELSRPIYRPFKSQQLNRSGRYIGHSCQIDKFFRPIY